MKESKEKIIIFPQILREVLKDLNETNLTIVYDSEEWTVAQLVHHIADAHMNKFSQLRAVMSGSNKNLDEYPEGKWVNLPGGNDPDISTSLKIIEGVYARTIKLLEAVTESELKKTAIYGSHGEVTLSHMIERFVAHGYEHIEQIENIKKNIN